MKTRSKIIIISLISVFVLWNVSSVLIPKQDSEVRINSPEERDKILKEVAEREAEKNKPQIEYVTDEELTQTFKWRPWWNAGEQFDNYELDGSILKTQHCLDLVTMINNPSLVNRFEWTLDEMDELGMRWIKECVK